MPVPAKTVDDYLSALSADQRAALQKLRRTIHAAAPAAEECISYQVPAFRLGGKALVAFGAAAKHCSFFPMSPKTIAAHAEELERYETSKGTIRFAAAKPLPAALVRKLVKTRVAELVGSGAKPARAGGAKRPARAEGAGSQTNPGVAAFLRELDHPLKKEIESVRRILLGVSPSIREGVKWNAPSFRTSEYFATFFLRSRDSVQLVFHLGAKVKDGTQRRRSADPAGLAKWLATDRCLVTLGRGKEIAGNRAAFEAFVRQWIRGVR
jgi:uncharacterized protein YdhG (YjbR/CyaY superfamily)